MFLALARATALLHSLCWNEIIWRICFPCPMDLPAVSVSDWGRRRQGRAWVAVLWVCSSVCLRNTFCASPVWEFLPTWLSISFLYLPNFLIWTRPSATSYWWFMWKYFVGVVSQYSFSLGGHLQFVRLDICYFCTLRTTLHMYLCS